MEVSLKDIAELLGSQSVVRENPFAPWMGKAVFIRSVTHHYIGRVSKLVSDNSAILEEAAWIADDGRFADALEKSELCFDVTRRTLFWRNAPWRAIHSAISANALDLAQIIFVLYPIVMLACSASSNSERSF